MTNFSRLDLDDCKNSDYDKLDLHRYTDDIILVSESGKQMKRELDLIDVWLIRAMPFAQFSIHISQKKALIRYILRTSLPKVLTKHVDGSLHYTLSLL